MTNLFRMSVAFIIQSMAMILRSVLFFLLALLRPLDMIADGLFRISYWLAVDNDVIEKIQYKKERREDDGSGQ